MRQIQLAAKTSKQDPYSYDPADIREPPTTWIGCFPYLGPGFILSASIVGSGELIATTTLGAEVGFVALWIVILSCVVKVALQLEFGRHAIQHGRTTMESFNRFPGPRVRGVSWTIWSWLAMQPLKILQVGGIIGGIGLLLNLVVPEVSVAVWCWIAAFIVAFLVSLESYRLIERSALLLLVAFTLLTLTSVFALQWTEFRITWENIGSGLNGTLPADSLFIVFGMIGLTGVSSDEIMQYNYWLLEKGYASYAGEQRRDDPEWNRRARRWISIMYVDALLSMVAYTILTTAFYLLGAAVLHARGTIPEGYAMIDTLASMYTETLGPWAKGVFLLGAFTVLFSTLFSALAAWTRIFSDAFGQLGFFDFRNPDSRSKAFFRFAWFFPMSWATIFLYYKQPVFMIVLAGVATSGLLLIVVYAALRYRYFETSSKMKPGLLYDVLLWTSCLTILSLAVYGILQFIIGN